MLCYVQMGHKYHYLFEYINIEKNIYALISLKITGMEEGYKWTLHLSADLIPPLLSSWAKWSCFVFMSGHMTKHKFHTLLAKIINY